MGGLLWDCSTATAQLLVFGVFFDANASSLLRGFFRPLCRLQDPSERALVSSFCKTLRFFIVVFDDRRRRRGASFWSGHLPIGFDYSMIKNNGFPMFVQNVEDLLPI